MKPVNQAVCILVADFYLPPSNACFRKKTEIPMDIHLNWNKRTVSNDCTEFSVTLVSEGIGLRLDQFLSKYCSFISRNQFLKLIEKKQVLLNGHPAKKSTRVACESHIVFLLQNTEDKTAHNQDASIEADMIIKQTEQWIVVNKPPFMTVHPTSRYRTGTLIQSLKHMLKLPTLHLCHRLDRETSGLILLAKNAESANVINTLFQKHHIKKKYTAIVKGTWPKNQIILKGDLERDMQSHVFIKQKVAWSEQSSVVTHITASHHVKQHSVLEIEILSGKMHQIRSHLAGFGFPIIGDKIYSDESAFIAHINQTLNDDALPMKRHALHAHGLEFTCPFTQCHQSLQVPVPKDMFTYLQEFY